VPCGCGRADFVLRSSFRKFRVAPRATCATHTGYCIWDDIGPSTGCRLPAASSAGRSGCHCALCVVSDAAAAHCPLPNGAGFWLLALALTSLSAFPHQDAARVCAAPAPTPDSQIPDTPRTPDSQIPDPRICHLLPRLARRPRWPKCCTWPNGLWPARELVGGCRACGLQWLGS
jgi:hypothetical protein